MKGYKEHSNHWRCFMSSGRVALALVFVLVVIVIVDSSPQAAPPTAKGHQALEDQLPPTYVPPGKQTYKEYCAACHGFDGKGGGPAASSLNRQPPNLTTLAKRHGGKFPDEYVKGVLLFGPGFSAHGASEMPVWGPIFRYVENYNEAAVRQRIKNLSQFIESIQER
jgi:mono/diheme cytochrome c family protein